MTHGAGGSRTCLAARGLSREWQQGVYDNTLYVADNELGACQPIYRRYKTFDAFRNKRYADYSVPSVSINFDEWDYYRTIIRASSYGLVRVAWE